MRLTVLHNPEAGDCSWTSKRVERMLCDAGHEPIMVESSPKWRKRLEHDVDAYVAVGGDGTVHKLARAIEDRDRPIAIIPAGTANNVAHALGYREGDDQVERVANWKKHERVLSIARVQHGADTRACIEVTGAGAFAAMRQQRKPAAPAPTPAEVLAAVRRALARTVLCIEPVHIEAEIDGAAHTGDYVLFECLNLAFCGPRLRLAPKAAAHQSSLWVVGVREEQREGFAAWITSGDGDPAAFTIGRGRRIQLRATGATHVDGKIWPKKGSDELVIRGGASKLRVWV